MASVPLIRTSYDPVAAICIQVSPCRYGTVNSERKEACSARASGGPIQAALGAACRSCGGKRRGRTVAGRPSLRPGPEFVQFESSRSGEVQALLPAIPSGVLETFHV